MPLRHCRKDPSTALRPVLKGNEKRMVAVNLLKIRNQSHCWCTDPWAVISPYSVTPNWLGSRWSGFMEKVPCSGLSSEENSDDPPPGEE